MFAWLCVQSAEWNCSNTVIFHSFEMNHFYNLNWKCTQNKSDFRHNSSEKNSANQSANKVCFINILPETRRIACIWCCFQDKSSVGQHSNRSRPQNLMYNFGLLKVTKTDFWHFRFHIHFFFAQYEWLCYVSVSAQIVTNIQQPKGSTAADRHFLLEHL